MKAIAIAGISIALLGLAGSASAARVPKKQLWGAVAYNSASGAFGYAVDAKTRRDAEVEAFRQCGSECDVIKSFRNRCGAIAAGTQRYVWETGASREIAEKKALSKCRGGACRIAAWACTSQR